MEITSLPIRYYLRTGARIIFDSCEIPEGYEAAVAMLDAVSDEPGCYEIEGVGQKHVFLLENPDYVLDEK